MSEPNQSLDAPKNNPGRPNDPPLGIGEQLSRIAERVKPYKEIAVLLLGLCSAISAGIAWTVSHFATAAAVSELECRISYNNGVKTLADGAAATDAATELRHAQVRVLAVASQSPATTTLMVNQLLAEADAITAAHAKEAAASAQTINNAFTACLRAISPRKSETSQ